MPTIKVFNLAVLLLVIAITGDVYAGVETEPNNTESTANQLSDLQASASIDDETDWFRVQLPTTGTIKVRLAGVPSNLQVQLGVKGFPHAGWVDGAGNVEYVFDAANLVGYVWIQFKWANSICGSDWCAVQFTPDGSWQSIKTSANMPSSYEGLPVASGILPYQLIIEAPPIPLVGDSNNNILTIGLGNYTVDGGAGSDTVAVPLFPNEYEFTQSASNRYTSRYRGFTSTLENVEYIEFGSSDFKTRLPIADLVSGQVQIQLTRLTDVYLAFFGRAPDVEGLEYWQQQHLANGMSLREISKRFSWEPEAKALFPTTATNEQLINAVYLNCFGRNPDNDGFNYWLGRLNTLNPQSADYLNERGTFIGELLLGAYAETSGDEDRSLLINRHEVGLYYVNQLAIHPGKQFDVAINDLLSMVTDESGTRHNAEDIIDYVFARSVELSNVMSDQSLFDSLWTTCIDQPEMAEISGVWDLSYDAGVQGHDVIYVQINADGSYIVFDYAGDTFDNEGNCYWTDQGQLTSLGNGVFMDSYDGTSAAFKVCGDQLTISDDSGSETYNRATVTDFTPICN